MAKAKKWILNILILLITTGLTLYFVFRGRDLGDIARLMSKASPLPCILAVITVTVFILCESVIIKLLTRAAGHTAKILHCFLYSFVGFFFSGITPSASGGQPMQAYFMKKDGIPVSVSAPVLAIVTVLYKGVLILTSLFVLIVRPAALMKYLEPAMFWIVLGMALNIVFVAALMMCIFTPGIIRHMIYSAIRIYKRIRKGKDVQHLFLKADSWIQGYRSVTECFRKSRGTVTAAFIITVFQRYALFSVTWLCCIAFGINAGGAVTVTLLQAMIASAVDMLPLPGGTGISESVFSTVFTPLLGDRLTLPVMVMSRGISYYWQILLSTVFTITAFLTLGRKKLFSRNQHP